MSLKITNKGLAFLFTALLLIVLFFILLDSDKNERTFREVLVEIDTTAVTEILIYPKSQKHQEVKLFKDDTGWKVALTGGKKAKVADQKIHDILLQLLAAKPKKLAARDKARWNEFQVDSTGSRVKVMEGSEVTLDLVIGRFSFQQPRTMNTFVRLYNDTDVYEVDGFLDMTFNQNSNSFRDGTIINADYNSWTQLQFNYPADSSFQLVKKGNNWLLNGANTDSLKTINYLRRIARLSNNSFLDNINFSELKSPAFSLNITTADFNFIEVKAYIDSSGYIIHSTQNPDALFDGTSTGKTLFVSRLEFLPAR